MANVNWDAVIIGGGVVGCAIARELSRYDLSICLLEKEEDVCSGTSKANSAIVHAGFDAKPGSLKAKMNVRGSRMMSSLAMELDFHYEQNGAFVLCFSEDDLPQLHALQERGIQNGVEDLRILTGDELRKYEPNVSDAVVAALHAPTSAIVCPFGLTIALAENACENGVVFRINEQVKNICTVDGHYEIHTSRDVLHSRCVINAAGVYADEINNMVSARKLSICPRKGEYLLLDREVGNHVSTTIFQLPGKYGKGVLVTPTVHGNLLIGPSARDIDDKADTATTRMDMADVMQKSALSVREIPYNRVITSFSGLRAGEAGGDFVLGETQDAPGFFNAAGIESPGLSSAPAIGEYIAAVAADWLHAAKKKNFNPKRKGIVNLAGMPVEDRAELIRQNPLYGRIVCRCEQISEGEIIDAIRRPVGAVSLDGVKRRVRAGMGRCQAGFCTPRVMEILAGELQIPMAQVCKNADGSQLLTGEMKEGDA